MAAQPAPVSLETAAKEVPLWKNSLVWLIGADVLFVALAGWIAVAGHSPIRWLGVLVLMLVAGSIGFIGYFFPAAAAPPAPKLDPKDNPKIRVHFVDELPKRRS